MNRFVSSILIVLLLLQSSTPTYAQSSIPNQMFRLQECINDRFDVISAELTQIEGIPIEIDGTVRLRYSKYVLEQLLFSMDQEISQEFANATYWGSFALVGTIGAVISENKTKIAKARFSTLEQEYAVSQLNGKEIRAGKTATIASEVKFWKSAIPITRYLTRGLFLFTAVSGWVALQNLMEVMPKKTRLYFADESMFRLKYAVSEYEFYRVLREDLPMMDEIRQKSLMICRSTTPKQIMDVLNSLVTSTKKEQASAFAQIQKDINSLHQD